jgi:hypothetical protein
LQQINLCTATQVFCVCQNLFLRALSLDLLSTFRLQTSTFKILIRLPPLCRLRSGEGTCLRSIPIEAGESSLSTQAADRRCFRDNLRQLFRGRHVQKEDLQAQRWGGAAWNPLLTAFRRAIGRFGADDDPEVRDVVLSASGGIFTILRRAQLAGWLASDHGVNN